MRRYLVTGATGFLGGHLVGALLAEGHGVVALCRQDEPELEDLGVRVFRGDILDAESVAAAARGVDGAFHCAGKVSRKLADAEELFRTHVEGTKKVLQGCEAAGVKRVVIASTSGTVAVGEDPKHIATEDDPAPVGILSRWPYYRSKLYAEEAALAARRANFEVVSLNPTLLLGPGDERRSSTEDVELFLDRRIPAVPAGGISFVDVRDVATGMIAAMAAGASGRRYLLGACNLTLREFFARLEHVSGVRAPLVALPRMGSLVRSGAKWLDELQKRPHVRGLLGGFDPVSFEMAQYYWYLDSTRAHRELGWIPRDPMATLRDTVEDLARPRGRRGTTSPSRIRGAVGP
jgi:dihydroflavonol-4-reductase